MDILATKAERRKIKRKKKISKYAVKQLQLENTVVPPYEQGEGWSCWWSCCLEEGGIVQGGRPWSKGHTRITTVAGYSNRNKGSRFEPECVTATSTLSTLVVSVWVQDRRPPPRRSRSQRPSNRYNCQLYGSSRNDSTSKHDRLDPRTIQRPRDDLFGLLCRYSQWLGNRGGCDKGTLGHTHVDSSPGQTPPP